MKKLKKYAPSYTKEKIPRRYLKDLNISESKKMVSEILTRPQNLKFWTADKAYEKRLKKEKRKISISKYYAQYIKKYGKENTGSLEKISKATKIDLNILKEVRKRGIGAWTSGHRPGVKPNQWAMARVYSFVMGGKTVEKTDRDLWDKIKKRKNPTRKKNSKAYHADDNFLDLLIDGFRSTLLDISDQYNLQSVKFYISKALNYRSVGSVCTDCELSYGWCDCEYCEDCNQNRCICDYEITSIIKAQKVIIKIANEYLNKDQRIHFKSEMIKYLITIELSTEEYNRIIKLLNQLK